MSEPTKGPAGAPSAAELTAAAEVVGGRDARALLLSVRNEGLGWVPLTDAVALGLAYAVTPRRDLLCLDLDLDSPDHVSRSATFERVLAAAARSELPYVACDSGRPGHRHLFIVTGELADDTRDRLDAALRVGGLDVRRSAVRPPWSPHRDGSGRSTPSQDPAVLHQAARPEAVAAFCTELGAGQAASTAGAAATSPDVWSAEQLSGRMRAVLVDGFARHGYRSASEARMAVAVAAVASGATAADLHHLFCDPAHRVGVTYRRRRESWQLAESARLAAKAAAWLGTPHHSIEQWSAQVAAARWVGQAGLTDLAVAELFARTARRRSTPRVAFARDEVAVEAGVATSTARRSLRRLVAAGWLRVVAAPTATTATVYELTAPADAPAVVDHPAPGVAAADLGCDATRRGALGRAAVRLWRLLGRPVTAAELAESVGVTPSTVRQHLGRLAAAGCAVVDGRLWGRAGDLEAVAVACGVAGTRQLRRDALVALRAARRRWLERYRLPPGHPTPA